jgi:uncharacterized protein (TIGR02145 family)
LAPGSFLFVTYASCLSHFTLTWFDKIGATFKFAKNISGMKTKNNNWIYFLALAGFFMIIISACSKSSDDSTPAPTPITDADGNVYTSVTIGTQVWMVENLKTTKFNDGTAIPLVTDASWVSLTTPAYCWYQNEIGQKSIYGALYNWMAVNTNKLAPAGWHVATDADWATLVTYLGGDTLAGGKLKSTGTIEAVTGLWLAPNTGATNSAGFKGYPGGFRNSTVDGFDMINRHGFWWTSTVYGTSTAWAYELAYDNAAAYRNYNPKTGGYSVRCVKN